MAKKNLAALMSGIMGDAKTDGSSEPTPHPTTASHLTVQMLEQLDYKRKRKSGRPRKGEEPVKTTEIHATFIVEADLVKKLKYISLVDCLLLKEVVSMALTDYIEAWEKKNGRVILT